LARLSHILVLADIEGSSGCWSYEASAFGTRAWARACLAMSRDVDAVARALFAAGVRKVTVKDFHRTGYNLLREQIDPRARIVFGYRRGPVPGIGDPQDAGGLLMLGMHAASGTEGFLAHTLTSRVRLLEVNGKPMAEAELFAASLAPFGVRPLFFSGCPTACRQAQSALPGIRTHPIDKAPGAAHLNVRAWRLSLAQAAAASLDNPCTAPYRPAGPFRCRVVMRDGSGAAARLSTRWGVQCAGDTLFLRAPDIEALYGQLIRLCYLSPSTEKALPLVLPLFHLQGRLGAWWVKRQVRTLSPGHDPVT